MSEHQILFSPESVRAILDGRKSQTRRVLKPQPCPEVDSWHWGASSTGGWGGYLGERLMTVRRCPYGQPGEVLWVRETHAFYRSREIGGGPAGTIVEQVDDDGDPGILYAADGYDLSRTDADRWRRSIHMPRWACRLLLKVEAVRVERLQEINSQRHDDVLREGWPFSPEDHGKNPVRAFARAWDKLNGKRAPWSSNPWVWVVNFSREGEAR